MGYTRLPNGLRQMWPSFVGDRPPSHPPHGIEVLVAFTFYLTIQILFLPAIASLWIWWQHGSTDSVAVLEGQAQGWFSALGMLVAATCLGLYSAALRRTSSIRIFEQQSMPVRRRLQQIRLGMLTWFIAFPVAIACKEIVGTMVSHFFSVSPLDQVAVQHLRSTFAAPSLLAFTIFGIVVCAPLTEEILFRGFLQSWLRSRRGHVFANLSASALFSCSHFSVSQGFTNLELLAALFALSLFLGYLYARTQALWASVALHSTFNAISTLLVIYQSSLLTEAIP